jgi:indolepyruvate decarboxylase
MMTSLLFAYGILTSRSRQSAEQKAWPADAIRGRLYDLGLLPVLVDLDDPEADWFEGFVRAVDRAEPEGPLDAFEQVDEGLSWRVWVYLHARPVPADAKRPLIRWRGKKRAQLSPPAASTQGDF